MRIFATLFLLFAFTLPAFGDAGSAVHREGVYVDQYAITDPDNHSGFNNIRVIIAHNICEVLIQNSGADTRTYKANLLCWCDSSETLCPDDDIGGGVMREPEIVFLNDIMTAGAVTMGDDLSDLRTKEIYGQFWNEYTLKGSVVTMVDSMVTEGLNTTQQKRALKFGLYMDGLPLTNADTVSTAYIDTSAELDFADFGLATVPLRFRRWVKIFGGLGWFE